MVLDGELKGRRAEVIDALSKAGIQSRPLASRNFLKQPVMKDLDYIVQTTTNNLNKDFEYIFITGGLGPTHDDITAESISKAFGL